MYREWIEEGLKIVGPLGLAIAWLWNERRKAAKEQSSSKLTEADRERAYSDRMEARLKVKEQELEHALLALMEARMGTIPPEILLKEIVDADPGVMFIKKRLAAFEYEMVRVSIGYARLYLGSSALDYDGKSDFEIWGPNDFNKTDEEVYSSQTGKHIRELINAKTGVTGYFVGRKFPVRLEGVDYIVGIGSHED